MQCFRRLLTVTGSFFLFLLIIANVVILDSLAADKYQENQNRLQSKYDLFQELYPNFTSESVSGMKDLETIAEYERGAVEDFVDRIPLFKGEARGDSFGAQESLLRAVVAEVLLRLARLGNLEDYDTNIDQLVFDLKDVESGVWFEKAMKVAVHNGVFVPKNGLVRPADPVNWAELVTILRRYLQLLPMDIKEQDNNDSLSDVSIHYIFEERIPSGEWFSADIYTLINMGILSPELSFEFWDVPNKLDFVLLLSRAIGEGSIFAPQADPDQVFSCYDLQNNDYQLYCLSLWGAVSDDPSTCEDIYDETYYFLCLNSYAVLHNDVELCKNISDISRRQQCEQYFKQDEIEESYCDSILDDLYRGFCFSELARIEVDIDQCARINNQFTRGYCIEDIAEDLDDIELCNQIDREEGRHYCISGFARRDENLSLCEGLIEIVAARCIRDIAEDKMDVELCGNIIDDGVRDSCYRRILPDLGLIDLCERIISLKNRNSCYTSISEKFEDASLCDHIDSEEDQGSCKSGVALRLRDADLCLSITHPLSSYLCLQGIAISLKDATICDFISDESDKNECIVQVQKEIKRREKCHYTRNVDLRNLCYQSLIP